jgi:molybdate/tungstate transport system ATP-binding protein
VLQSGPPEVVFRQPANPYIAEFLGAENVFAGEVRWLSAPADEAPGESGREVAGEGRALEFRTDSVTIYAVGDASQGPGDAVLRAEEVLLSLEPQSSSARNQFRGKILEVATLGALTRVTVAIGDQGKEVPLIAALTTRSAREMELREGREVSASFKAMAVHLC